MVFPGLGDVAHLGPGQGPEQERLAELAGVEPRYVQTLESGRANPTAAIQITLAQALETTAGPASDLTLTGQASVVAAQAADSQPSPS